MLGPPGVGKTAIVAQVAAELGINYVSYSITHHTRQTALGLPYIVERIYDGRTFQVSEYTMSEIIGAVHEARERTGVPEGILFLDEVNCVSETLAPAMLQFLQHKTFGQHELPEGWVIVTAGNPPEYNRAAREFDPAMMDRMKCITVGPDVGVWLRYAAATGVHPAVLGYLEAKPSAFYLVRADVRGMRLVTARGWDDLSHMLCAYEAENLVADEELVRQYLQDDETARDFAVHYALFCKYRDDYRIADVLDGAAGEGQAVRAAAAPFDERMAVVGLLADAVCLRLEDAMLLKRALTEARACIVQARDGLLKGDTQRLEACNADEAAGQMRYTGESARVEEAVRAERMATIDEAVRAAREAQAGGGDVYGAVRMSFNAACARQGGLVAAAGSALQNAYGFLDAAFGGQSQETLVFTTRISANQHVVSFVAEHGSDSFIQHNRGLLVEDRRQSLLAELEALG